jgi:Holliday junction resolvasome RuvABC endonuclease subunit
MIYLGIDPGSSLCGWAIVDMDKKEVLTKGHNDLNFLRELIQQRLLDGVMIEGTIRYQMSNPVDLLLTTIMVGRLMEISEGLGITTTVMNRPNVIKSLTGKWPGRTNKVSKTQLQGIVQKQLGLEKPIRPQHANDAVALVLAVLDPVKAIVNVKPTRQKRGKTT